MDGLVQPAIASGHYPETKSQSGKRFFMEGGVVIKNRCSRVSLVLPIAVGAFLICALSVQADTPPGTGGVTGGCVGNVAGLHNPSCTANDVRLTSIDPATVIITGPSCDSVPDHCSGIPYECQGGT